MGLEHTSSRLLLARTISALVPTSTTKVISSLRSGASARITPAASAPTCPAMQGRQYSRASGCALKPISAARVSIASLVVSAKGAVPRLTGLMPSTMWCMIGLATKAISRMSSTWLDASVDSSANRPLIASRIALVSNSAPSGCIIT